MSTSPDREESTLSRLESSGSQAHVLETLRALGGQGTLGDIVVLTGLPRGEVEDSLEALMANDRGQVKVSESGTLIYHLQERRGAPRPIRRRGVRERARTRWRTTGMARAGQVWFDRRTLRLIRAREGVISLAELVEHTGLPLSEAEEEMRRLAECYGGKPYPSWDGHIVYAFPELMISAHGRFAVREPRPAWVTSEDPMRLTRRSRRSETAGVILSAVGLVSSATAPWLVFSQLGGEGLATFFGLVVAPSAAGIFLFGRSLLRGLGHHRYFRFRQTRSLRRYALGLVFQTALAGKGVVSLDRTVAHLQARAGKRKVKRSAVEEALRELAREFDAPVTEVNGDLFFGFRNVKRQFLASHVQRRRLQLAQTAFGRIVFDSADSPRAATERDLESFDRDLDEGDPTLPDVHFVLRKAR